MLISRKEVMFIRAPNGDREKLPEKQEMPHTSLILNYIQLKKTLINKIKAGVAADQG